MSDLIVLFSADLLFSSKVEAVARNADFEIVTIDNPAHFGEESEYTRPGEPVDGGRLTKLTHFLTEEQPALLIFELGNDTFPTKRWISVLKSSPATRRLPILAYSPHVKKQAMADATDAGANKVVTRGEMAMKGGQLMKELAKSADTAAINAWCAQPLPDAARASIDLFNAGEFYEAHHALEALWMEDKGAARDFYRAILQVAVAYYQIGRGNYRGGVKMFLRVRQWLAPLPDVCRGVDLAQLREDTEAAFERLTELGAERVEEFGGDFQPIKLVES